MNFLPWVAAGAVVLGAGLGVMLDRSGFNIARGLPGVSRGAGREWARSYLFFMALVWMAAGLASPGSWSDAAAASTFRPAAAAFGGLAAGLALGVLGTCNLGLAAEAARLGVRAAVALLAWAAGVAAALSAPVAPLIERLNGAGAVAMPDAGLAGALGLPQWLVLCAAGAAVFAWLLRAPVSVSPRGMEWPKQGAVLALAACAGWALAVAGGEPAGLNGVAAVRDALSGLTGAGRGLGPSFYAAAGLVGFGLVRSILKSRGFAAAGAAEAAAAAGAGFLLGIGSAVAGGGPIAHGFFGIGLLRLDSMVFVAAMWIGGNVKVIARRERE